MHSHERLLVSSVISVVCLFIYQFISLFAYVSFWFFICLSLSVYLFTVYQFYSLFLLCTDS